MTRRTYASVCPHDCPSACALEVTTEAGRIVDVVGDRAHPFTRGVICGTVHDYAEHVCSPLCVATAYAAWRATLGVVAACGILRALRA